MLTKQSTPFRAPSQADWVRISKGAGQIHAPSLRRLCPLLTRKHFLNHSQVCRRPKCHLSRTVRPLWRDHLQRAEKKSRWCRIQHSLENYEGIISHPHTTLKYHGCPQYRYVRSPGTQGRYGAMCRSDFKRIILGFPWGSIPISSALGFILWLSRSYIITGAWEGSPVPSCSSSASSSSSFSSSFSSSSSSST